MSLNSVNWLKTIGPKPKPLNLTEALKEENAKREKADILTAKATAEISKGVTGSDSPASLTEAASATSTPTLSVNVPVLEDKGDGTSAITTSVSEAEMLTIAKERGYEVTALDNPTIKRITLVEYTVRRQKALEVKKFAVGSTSPVTEKTPVPQKKTEKHASHNNTAIAHAQPPFNPRTTIGQHASQRDTRLTNSAGEKRTRKEYQVELTASTPEWKPGNYVPSRDPRLLKNQCSRDTAVAGSMQTLSMPAQEIGHYALQGDPRLVNSASKKRGREENEIEQTQMSTGKKQKVDQKATPDAKRAAPAAPAAMATPEGSARKKRFREETEDHGTKEKDVPTTKKQKPTQFAPTVANTPSPGSSNTMKNASTTESDTSSSSSDRCNYSRRATDCGPGTKGKGKMQGMRGVAQTKGKANSRPRSRYMDGFIV